MNHKKNVLTDCNKVLFLKTKVLIGIFKNLYNLETFLKVIFKNREKDWLLHTNEERWVDGNKEKNPVGPQALIGRSKPLVFVVLQAKAKGRAVRPPHLCSSWAEFLWPAAAFQFLRHKVYGHFLMRDVQSVFHADIYPYCLCSFIETMGFCACLYPSSLKLRLKAKVLVPCHLLASLSLAEAKMLPKKNFQILALGKKYPQR